MSVWQEMENAPKNDSGESFGPWILAFHAYDAGIYQVRWECHGTERGWRAKNKPSNFMSHQCTHWMPLPARPAAMNQ